MVRGRLTDHARLAYFVASLMLLLESRRKPPFGIWRSTMEGKRFSYRGVWPVSGRSTEHA